MKYGFEMVAEVGINVLEHLRRNKGGWMKSILREMLRSEWNRGHIGQKKGKALE